MLGDDNDQTMQPEVIPNPVTRVSNEPILGNLEGLSYVPKPYEAPEFVS